MGAPTSPYRIYKWPSNPRETVAFSALAEPIIKAIRWGYKLSRRRRGEDVPYEGLDLGKSMKASCLPPDELLRAENLDYSEEDQGRDLLEELVGLAIQLGIEQGRRIEAEQRGPWDVIASPEHLDALADAVLAVLEPALAAERERCAKVAESAGGWYVSCENIAKAIRALPSSAGGQPPPAKFGPDDRIDPDKSTPDSVGSPRPGGGEWHHILAGKAPQED